MVDLPSSSDRRRFPAGYGRWLWERVQVYLLVSFVLTNLFFVWAAVKAGRYSVIGGITGFWLLALAPWCGPLLDRMFPSSARVIAGPFFVLESQIDPCSGADDIIAGALLLWALSSTGPRIATPG
jgi:hypothetical protein